MFYDERIEKEKGKICQNAMALTVAFALPYWVLHTLYVIKTLIPVSPFLLVTLDGIIVLAGLVLLTVGLLRNRGNDEREQVERYRYYSRVTPWYLGLVGLCYAVLLPMGQPTALLQQYDPYGLDRILEPLAFVVGIYLFYSLKKREIYFNYSMMEEDRYYPRVWKNIGKFALWLLAGLAISLTTLALLSWIGLQSSQLFFLLLKEEGMGIIALKMLGKYLGLLVGGSVLYLFLSFLERESYKKLTGPSRAAGWSLVVTAGLYGLNWGLVEFILYLLGKNNHLAVSLSQYQSYGIQCMRFALMMFLIYFSTEYQRCRPHRAIRFGCNCILLTATLFTVLEQYWSFLLVIFARELYQLPNFLTLYSSCLIGATQMRSLLYLASGSMILLALIQHRMLSRWNLLAIPTALAALAVTTVLWLQTGGGGITADLSGAVTILLLGYLCILLFCVIRKTEQEDTSV